MERMRTTFITLVALVGLEIIWQGFSPGMENCGQEKKEPAKNVQNPNENNAGIDTFLKYFSIPIRIHESNPVTVKDAQFIVVAQTDWKPANPDISFPMVAPIEMQLRIANLGRSDVIFPTFQTFGIRISDADGKEVKPHYIRKGDFSTRPVLLPAGVSHTLCPRAELRWNEKAKASELIYFDGTGSNSVIGPLACGRYKLAFWYSVSPSKEGKQKTGEPATWVGEVVTDDVLIEVIDGTTRGLVTAPERLMWDFTEALRIRESKPVTKNEAKLVVVAQTDWRPKKFSGVVPIEIQLRITNLGKEALIFPTFDTFDIKLFSADGKNVMSRSDRNLTKLTRPVLIPPGATYSLAAEGGASSLARRRAELHWNFETKGSELRYHDGTGREICFGPLEPGRYNLAFRYTVTRKGPFKTERDPATWLGEVVSDHVLIEVGDR
jgi:hypothetical protein